MNDLITAAQQALEALEQCGLDDTRRNYALESAAITALRAALAEPVQEPVAWRITDGEGGWDYHTELPEDWSRQWSARYGRKHEPLYTAPPQHGIGGGNE